MIRWTLTGTLGQQAIAREAFSRIKFPFERLTQLPGSPELGWRDLNPGMPMTVRFSGAHAAEAEEARSHDDHGHGGEDKPHGIEIVLADGRRFTLALIYTVSGRIYLDVRLEAHPAVAMESVGAEVAHAVDFFLPMTDDQRSELLRLWGVGGTWWEVQDYGAEYFTLGGEAFMGEFVKAYSDMPFDQSAFLHDSGVEPADVRRVLGIERTDYVPPKPHRPEDHFQRYGKSLIYHRFSHYKRLGTPLHDLTGLRPCKTCKPQEAPHA